jgi:hypothetical protein
MSDQPETSLESEDSDSEGSSPSGRTVAGWYLDQTGRFQERFWDGSAWTEHVRTGLREQSDPLIGGAAHIRLAPVDPNDRLVTDIAQVLGRGPREVIPPEGEGPMQVNDVVAQSQPATEPSLSPSQPALAPEQQYAVRLANRTFIAALVSVIVAVVPVIGTVGVLAGPIAVGVALRARRRCSDLGLRVSRAVDAALLGVLAASAAAANVLVTVQLSNDGAIYEAVVCSFEQSSWHCVGSLLRAATTIVARLFAVG